MFVLSLPFVAVDINDNNVFVRLRRYGVAVAEAAAATTVCPLNRLTSHKVTSDLFARQ